MYYQSDYHLITNRDTQWGNYLTPLCDISTTNIILQQAKTSNMSYYHAVPLVNPWTLIIVNSQCCLVLTQRTTDDLFYIQSVKAPHISPERLPFRTPGSSPVFVTCLCSKFWYQFVRTCRVFSRLFSKPGRMSGELMSQPWCRRRRRRQRPRRRWWRGQKL